MGSYRTFRYLLQPTARQTRALENLLTVQRELYNAALEERRGAWRWERRSVSFFDQSKTLTGVRDVRPDLVAHGVTVCRGTLKRLDRAFAGFYRRCKAGEAPGFPRFKSASRFRSVQWEDDDGWRLYEDRRRLHVHGLGDIKVRLHRPLRGNPRAITVARDGRRWWVSLRCADVPEERLPVTGAAVGIDLGVVNEIATSDGWLEATGRYGHRADARLSAARRSLSAKRPGSNRRRKAGEQIAAIHRKARNQRIDSAHKLSRQLVNDYDLIVHEDLRISNITRRPKPRPAEGGTYEPNGAAAKAGLNRSILDAGWGRLLAMIAYKAESAGREVIAVDPRNTSRRCAECGHVAAANRVSQAEFKCEACGHEAHADVNAAINILRAGRAQQQTAA